ncbi:MULTISPECIES: DUF1707 domain-containing protein [unclassified Crossiella]|uniref:DUF1707 SHOCT-like domain-containing protein n=1 Tax=unclassified Crossiella TaxID=2620835 RepID=UPI001FFEFA74|nr:MULTISPECIES: DUF1707 domain-containing protein [unclassified Crossiella]MCK2236268.1 DUF1707 domain-containing protein [Crossiella sp. S99.2]MCK2249935.1 DUF1707 domain-containing protein [Crossiella sp. S99.1]
MAGELEHRNLLVSDAERMHVVQLLERATGQGRISLAEFTTRSDRALTARTRGELNAVLMDVPGMVLNESVARGELVLGHNAMSSLERRGRWIVPGRLVLRGTAGSTLLDFTEAVIAEPVVTIELHNALGSTTLILPEGATVNVDSLAMTAGGVTDKVGGGDRPGDPHFILTGTVRFGSVEIKRPARKSRFFRR